MNQVIFANAIADHPNFESVFDTALVPIHELTELAGDGITDRPNEDFIIEYMTPSKTIKTIEVNRETLNIQKDIDTC